MTGMKILFYDCFSGISGDMNLGAMIDLGISPEYLKGQLSLLGMDDEFSLNIARGKKMGIEGTRVEVKLHHHDHDHPHPHRHLKDIEKLIDESRLSEKVKKLGRDIFMKIAVAEAKVHGKSLQDVHFHEVGATDSLVDIVGAAICFDKLGVDQVWSSPVELGGGFVDCAHGRMPVPAPATALIMEGIPVRSGASQTEMTTPTGAAILAATVNRFTSSIAMKIEKTGYGIGMRDLPVPNVLRVHLANVEEETTGSMILECNIDDMNPEQYDYVMERLFERGVDDVFLTPVIMKKGRPGIKVTVLCRTSLYPEITEIMLTETTTLGLRRYGVDKEMLDRKIITCNTPLGEVPFKTAFYRGEMIRMKPEWEACRRIASEKNMSIQQVYREIQKFIAGNSGKNET